MKHSFAWEATVFELASSHRPVYVGRPQAGEMELLQTRIPDQRSDNLISRFRRGLRAATGLG